MPYIYHEPSDEQHFGRADRPINSKSQDDRIQIGIADFLEPTVLLLEAMIDDLIDTDPHLCPALSQAQYSLKDAILRDELGTSDWFAPEWAVTLTSISPYVRTAIQNELSELAGTPPHHSRRAMRQSAKSLGRWASGGAIDHDDAKRALWKVINAAGFADFLGTSQAIEVLRTGWREGLSRPRFVSEALEHAHE